MKPTAKRLAESIHQRLIWASSAFRRDRRGSVAVFTALALVPMVVGVGIGIDTARAYMVRARLSQALDAAALAGGRVMYDAQRDADIQMYFTANFPQGFMDATVTTPTIVPDAGGQLITLSASATFPATFMKILGEDTITVKATTTASRANSGIELVLVMDNTGSMASNNKMTAMKSAAQSLVDTVYGANDTVPNLYVGLVPFVAMVNIGSGRASFTNTPTYTQYTISSLTRTSNSSVGSPGTSLMCATTSAAHGFQDGIIVDVSGANQSAYNRRVQIRTVSTTGCASGSNKFWYLIDTTSGTTPATGTIRVNRPAVSYPAIAPWAGCVEMRADPYETTSADATPATASFPKAFWPSTNGMKFYDMDTGSSRFKYRLDDTGGNALTGDNEWTTTSIDESQAAGNNSKSPNKGCPPPLTPLQPSKAVVTAAINAMRPYYGGGTAVPTGLAWGWRVLSPNHRGLWGAPTPATLPLDYGTDKMNKVVVLLTDGKNEVVDNKLPGCTGDPEDGYSSVEYSSAKCAPLESDYTAYGRMTERRFGSSVDTKTEITGELNSRITSLCTAMKARGIIIYTILLQVNDATTDALYRDCATKPEYYFNSPSASDLAGVFNQIAQQLSKLRLAK